MARSPGILLMKASDFQHFKRSFWNDIHMLKIIRGFSEWVYRYFNLTIPTFKLYVLCVDIKQLHCHCLAIHRRQRSVPENCCTCRTHSGASVRLKTKKHLSLLFNEYTKVWVILLYHLCFLLFCVIFVARREGQPGVKVYTAHNIAFFYNNLSYFMDTKTGKEIKYELSSSHNIIFFRGNYCLLLCDQFKRNLSEETC